MWERFCEEQPASGSKSAGASGSRRESDTGSLGGSQEEAFALRDIPRLTEIELLKALGNFPAGPCPTSFGQQTVRRLYLPFSIVTHDYPLELSLQTLSHVSYFKYASLLLQLADDASMVRWSSWQLLALGSTCVSQGLASTRLHPSTEYLTIDSFESPSKSAGAGSSQKVKVSVAALVGKSCYVDIFQHTQRYPRSLLPQSIAKALLQLTIEGSLCEVPYEACTQVRIPTSWDLLLPSPPHRSLQYLSKVQLLKSKLHVFR